MAVARDPLCLPVAGFQAADIILTEDTFASAPFVAPEEGVAEAIGRIAAVLAASPVAGAALALLLRSSTGLTVPAALIAESATYSALQEGAEFRRWRSRHSPRPPETGDERVVVEHADGELRIVLSRPTRRNAVDWRMRDALVSALASAARDPGRRVVLSGRGPDFCAGGDLDEFGSRPDPAIAHVIRLTRSPAMLAHLLAARTTAHLHGACIGAGIELPAFAHRVVAAPRQQVWAAGGATRTGARRRRDCQLATPDRPLAHRVPGPGRPRPRRRRGAALGSDRRCSRRHSDVMNEYELAVSCLPDLQEERDHLAAMLPSGVLPPRSGRPKPDEPPRCAVLAWAQSGLMHLTGLRLRAAAGSPAPCAAPRRGDRGEPYRADAVRRSVRLDLARVLAFRASPCRMEQARDGVGERHLPASCAPQTAGWR